MSKRFVIVDLINKSTGLVLLRRIGTALNAIFAEHHYAESRYAE